MSLNSFFKIEERGSTVRTEIIGGVTTFLAMAYIIFVNPDILSLAFGYDHAAKMPVGELIAQYKPALITVTALACGIGTLATAFIANVPLATGPGMGLNAFFTFSLVMGRGITWQTALGIVFISSVLYMIMAIGGIRQKLVDAIPHTLQVAVTGGIGLFIAFIGMKNMGLIVSNPATLVSLGKFTPTLLLGVFGLILIFVLEIKRIRGGMLIGILVTTALGMLVKIPVLENGAPVIVDGVAKMVSAVQMPSSIVSLPASIGPIALKLNIFDALKFSLIGPIFSFLFVNMFDGLGTLISCSKALGRVDKEGNVKDLGKLMQIDVGTTMGGSLLGTSTVCFFVESAAGIAAGAKTGLASVITGLLFLLSMFFSPVIGIVPGFATAAPLVMVGVFMFANLHELNFKDFKAIIPAFLTVIMMPLTYSISVGLSFGFISYIVIHILSGEIKKVNTWLIFIGILSVVNLMTM